MRYGYRCTQGFRPDVEALTRTFFYVGLCTVPSEPFDRSIADESASCLVPSVGIGPTPRRLEGDCSCPLSYKGLYFYVLLLGSYYTIRLLKQQGP